MYDCGPIMLLLEKIDEKLGAIQQIQARIEKLLALYAPLRS